MPRPRTIKGFIVTAAIVVSAVLFLAMYTTTTKVFEDAVKDNAATVSETLAQGTFNAMFQIMRQGWTRPQVEEFIRAVQKASDDTPYTIDIYRGELVTRLFGPINQKPMDSTINRTFRLRAPVSQETQQGIRHTYPLAARHECLRCHTNAHVGDVLGVIEVKQRTRSLIGRAEGKLLAGLVLITPVPLLVAFLVGLYFQKKVSGSLDVLQQNIDNINHVSDLTTIERRELDLGFVEFNDIFTKVGALGEKLKAVAVDKDLLEFEIRLLEKFVITSEVVKDWRDYIGHLLTDINQVIDAYALFSIFRIDDELFDLDIFWVRPPEQSTCEMMERAIRDALRDDPRFGALPSLAIQHHWSNTGGVPLRLTSAQIELQVKSLVVETPKIGGIVGIAVHEDIVEDEMRLLVMESILSTLLNVVGSVKAIYKYTKDLEYYATRDPLTNLYNQRIFWELLDYEVNRADRHGYSFALLVIDLDNFKSINDTYGHAFGDRFLQAFSEAVQHALRNGDVLARYGGDEFVVILPETELSQAHSIAARVLERTADMSVQAPDGARVKATVSIGISLYPEHARDARDLFLFADNMMYKAKSEGKNRLGLATEEDMVQVFRDLGEKSILISNAITEQRIVPYFQPIINAETGETMAVEVLSRLTLDEGGLLSANEFIELAEKMGLIHKLDYTVIDKAFQQLRAEDYQGLVFLNVSPRALVLGEFIRQLKRITAMHNMPPERVVFEITERDTVKNMSLLEKFVNELKREGFKLAIDDFGSGFSSFHYLKRFPIDFVKIEGDFVVNMISDPKDSAVVRSMASLTRQLGIKAVAEFVENEEVLKAVRDAGIEYAQGFYVGRPSKTTIAEKKSASRTAKFL